MRGTFGNGIAEHLMIPYARKIWTIEPREMEFGWIDRRVPTPDVERIIAGAVSDDVGQVGATSHFWYPKDGGIEALPRARRARRERAGSVAKWNGSTSALVTSSSRVASESLSTA